MDFVRSGNTVLYVWSGKLDPIVEKTVNELKEISNVTVKVENAERLEIASYGNSIFDVILSNGNHAPNLLGLFLKLVKPKGQVVLTDTTEANQIKEDIKLSGFVNITNPTLNVYVCEKPNYEVGSSAKLSFAKKTNNDKKVWKLDDDDEDEIIDADELLDEDDKQKPDPTTLRVCGTTGKRKACKDCSCGLAEELETENVAKKDTNPTQKSSCGSCYLGDAFRCATCPYLGMPAFKPGEKIQLSDNQLKADLV